MYILVQCQLLKHLKKGADIVITGRTTDTGLTLAPMIYEFGWDLKNYDLMAAGTIAGHILNVVHNLLAEIF